MFTTFRHARTTQETLALELEHKAQIIRHCAKIGYTDKQFAYLLKQQLDDLILALKELGDKC